MAKRIKKVCICCRKTYEIWCPTCKEALSQPVWMNEFHDENCLNIFQICSKYNMKSITAKKARRLLDKCDLSDRKNFTTSTQRIIDEIIDKTTTKKVEIKIKSDSDLEKA